MIGVRCIFLLFAFCAGIAHADEDNYAETLAQRPMPTDDAGRRAECAWIRQEEARLQNFLIAFNAQASVPGPYNYQAIYRAAAQMRVQSATAALESRAADVGCNAAFSNAPAPQAAPPVAPTPQGGLSFDECFQKCKQYTSRTNDQCFDSCKGSSSAGSSAVAPSAPGIDKSCRNNVDCLSSFFCVGSPRVCQHLRGDGEACPAGDERRAPLICDSGKCQ